MKEQIYIKIHSSNWFSKKLTSHRMTKGQFTHRRQDTTRQNATRPVFSLPIQSNGSVHTYAAPPSLVVTTKSCDNKNRSVKLSSHICNTTRHDRMRHDRAEDQGTTIF